MTKEQQTHLIVEQFDNGYSIICKEDGAEMFAEVVEGERGDINSRLGKTIMDDVCHMMEEELAGKVEIVYTIKVKERQE